MQRYIKSLLLFVCAFSVIVTLSSCEEDDDNKVAKAQKCLNTMTDTSSDPEIQACIDQIAGIDNVAANTVKCGAAFLLGNLTTTKIASAFDLYDDAAADQKEAVLIGNLALTSTAAADLAYEYCAKTETPGLLYIASLVRVGTLISVNGSGGNIKDDLTACANQVDDCNLPAIAESVLTLSELYCKGDAVDEQICKDIATAQASAGGDLEQLAILLINQFNY